LIEIIDKLRYLQNYYGKKNNKRKKEIKERREINKQRKREVDKSRITNRHTRFISKCEALETPGPGTIGM
jgi:hypothetical protein